MSTTAFPVRVDPRDPKRTFRATSAVEDVRMAGAGWSTKPARKAMAAKAPAEPTTDTTEN